MPFFSWSPFLKKTINLGSMCLLLGVLEVFRMVGWPTVYGVHVLVALYQSVSRDLRHWHRLLAQPLALHQVPNTPADTVDFSFTLYGIWLYRKTTIKGRLQLGHGMRCFFYFSAVFLSTVCNLPSDFSHWRMCCRGLK